jgi:hypothetical protein
MLAWTAIAALLLQDDLRVERAARLDESTVLFETAGTAVVDAVEANRGRAEVLWAGPGLALVSVPEGAVTARLAVRGRTSAPFLLEGARQITFGTAPSAARVGASPAGAEVDNDGDTKVLAVVRVREPGKRGWRFVAAVVVPPRDRRALVVAPGSEAVVVRAADASGGLFQRPDDPEALARAEMGFTLNFGPAAWRGFSAQVKGVFAQGLRADLPEVEAAGVDGLGQAWRVEVEIERVEFDLWGGGLTGELGLFRFSAGFVAGDWEGRGDLTLDDGLLVTTLPDARLEGELVGVELALHWPALRYREETLEIQIGPEAAGFWLRQELKGAEGSPVPIREEEAGTAGGPGARAFLRFVLPKVDLGVEGAVGRLFGDLAGTYGEVALVLTVRF